MNRPLLVSVALLLVACSDTGGDGDGSGGAGGGTSATGVGGAASTSVATSSTTGAVTSSTGSGSDPNAAARALCIQKINALRATKGLPAYGQWTSAETCADQQATSDEAKGKAHDAFGMCGESGQNECLGAGVSGIESCLQQMWDEKNQAGCAGCDACNDAYDPSCPNCDFYGSTTGDVCGHYVNMSALYFTEAACGFSEGGGWDTIDFH